jgi:hypothetical protein
MAQPPESEFQLACPVCSAFNPADFRFCPHCGHRLGAPDMVKEPSAPPHFLARLFRPLLVIILLLLVVAMGLDGSLWPRASPWLSRWWSPASRAPTTDVRQRKSDGDDSTLPLSTPPFEGDNLSRVTPLPPDAVKTPTTTRQPASALVELTLVDREGDRLRQARGILTSQERRVVTTFESIHGA